MLETLQEMPSQENYTPRISNTISSGDDVSSSSASPPPSDAPSPPPAPLSCPAPSGVLVQQLRASGAGPLGLAPAAPCGGRPRQLDAALAQERDVLRTALGAAVGCVEEAREMLANWLNRRAPESRSRPSLNEIKEIDENDSDLNVELPEIQELPEDGSSQSLDTSTPRTPRVPRGDARDQDLNASGSRTSIQSSGSSGSSLSTIKRASSAVRRTNDEDDSTNNEEKMKTSGSPRHSGDNNSKVADWLNRKKISSEMLHNELYLTQMGSLYHSSSGYRGSLPGNKSLNEIYGGTMATKSAGLPRRMRKHEHQADGTSCKSATSLIRRDNIGISSTSLISRSSKTSVSTRKEPAQIRVPSGAKVTTPRRAVTTNGFRKPVIDDLKSPYTSSIRLGSTTYQRCKSRRDSRK